MKLWYSTCTSSTPVHIALEEAGARYERVEVSWQRGVNVAELEALNPLGAVPVLVTDDGRALTQSLAILEHVADTHPASGLLQAPGTVERAETLGWVAFCAADLLRAFAPLVRPDAMTSSAAAQAELRAYGLEHVRPLLEHADRGVAGREFVVGDRFTVADAYLYFTTRLAGWLDVPVAAYRELARYQQGIEARPAVRRVLEREDLLD
ncbi:MAG: glutathione S-transferase N-terminal domain-containing protein [Planctomycetes bacterium]|nr:glutathione S-transferase N-terminal domain-containing protein [Planctomycetota bacterium]